MKVKKPIKLFAPETFWSSSSDLIAAKTNGCGPRGWVIDVIPDKILGLDISMACCIHDWMYFVGVDLKDKQEADRVFLNNLLRLIEGTTKFKPLRLARGVLALIYYRAVDVFGGPAFWKGKNPYSQFREVR